MCSMPFKVLQDYNKSCIEIVQKQGSGMYFVVVLVAWLDEICWLNEQ